MKVILLVLAIAVLANAYTDREYQTAFTNWMQEHNKVYTSDEFTARFAAFKTNMDYVRDWNAKGSPTVLGLTFLADLTNAEYRALYLGTKITVTTPLVADPPKTVTDTPTITLDWRTKGAVTGIKDQGQCGSCWAFSTVGSTEGAHFLKDNQLVSLSEQNLVDCSTAEGNDGCGGGLMSQGFEYIIKNKGIDTEASYPYTAADGTCKFNAANIGATISSYTEVTQGSESALLTAANLQPVSVAIDASHNSFQLYKSGVYFEPLCSQTQLDHGVLVVGYGTDKEIFGTHDFWIVKNSWGTVWGMQGYIYMSKDRNNNCGIATMASYPTI